MIKSEINKLDKIWSLIIRKRGRCEKCGRRNALQGAHIFSRRLKSTRYNLNNGVCLCAGCHRFWAHQNPVEFTDFVTKLKGEKVMNELRSLSQKKIKLFYDEVKASLEKELK